MEPLQPTSGFGRRQVLGAGLALPAMAAAPATMASPTRTSLSQHPALPDRRQLGALEVSSSGLGVQNMTRTYQTTVPTRSGMVSIIRTAHDSGVTFFDAAEAYGAHEVERLLGEAIVPIRNEVAITSKFGWNIDQETGQRRQGLNSRPEHVRRVVDGMLQRLRTDRIDLLYQHRVDPAVPIEDVAGGSVSPNLAAR
jgi:aryl-alcohol dehydrogenase-like predicted oxidoreductase